MSTRPTVQSPLARALSTIVIGGAASKGLLLASEIVLARLLGTEVFGRYAVGSSMIIVVSSMTLVGMDYSAIQLLARYRDDADRARRTMVVRVGLLFVTGVAGVAGLGIVLAAAPIARAAFGTAALAGVFQAVGVALFFESLNNYLSAVLRAEGRFWGHVAVFDGVRNLGLAVACGLVAFAGWGAAGALGLYAAASGAGTLVGLAWVAKLGLLGHAERVPGVTSEMTAFARSLAIWGVLQNSSSQTYVVVAGFFLTDTEVGALAVGLRVVVLLNFLRTAITAGVQRDFARLFIDGRMQQLERVLQRVSSMLFVVSGALCIPFLVGPTTVMHFFGPHWVPYAWILWPLLLPKLANVAGGPVGQLLIACGKGRAMLLLNAFEIGIQLVFLVPLMLLYGLAGAIAGEAIRVVVLLVARQLAVHRLLGVVSMTVQHGLVFGALCVAVGVGAALHRLTDGTAGYGLAVVAALVAYEALLRLWVHTDLTPLGLAARLARSGGGMAGRLHRPGRAVGRASS
jgi:O-antigen/teichoic acid export membrane protein